jgi:hypothetical protein
MSDRIAAGTGPATPSIVPFNVGGAQYLFLYAQNANLASIDNLSLNPSRRIPPNPVPGPLGDDRLVELRGLHHGRRGDRARVQGAGSRQADPILPGVRRRRPHVEAALHAADKHLLDSRLNGFIPFQLSYADPRIVSRVQYIFCAQVMTGTVSSPQAATRITYPGWRLTS